MADHIPSPASRLVRWRWTAALLALTQLATPPVISRVFGDFLSSGATNAAVITPAGYAFAIWGPITVLSAITSVAVLRWGLGSPWEPRVLAETSIVFAGFTTWLVLAAQHWLWLTVAMFTVMVAALVDVVRLLVRHAEDLTCPAWLRRLSTLTFGLYLGWSSIAVFVNVAAALIESGWSATETVWQATILIMAVIAAVVLTIAVRGTPGYVAAALWALIAAAIGAAHRGSVTLATASACAAALVLIAAATYLIGTRPGGPITGSS
jgi:hypothetical protein